MDQSPATIDSPGMNRAPVAGTLNRRTHVRLSPPSVSRTNLPPQARARRRTPLRLAQARAEEAIIRAHVDNALMFVDTLAEDLTFDRAIDSYIREMAIPEPLASTVATRTLVVLGQDLVPYRKRAREENGGAAEGVEEQAQASA